MTLVKNSLPLIDIGANLLDEMYKGIYHGRPVHSEDIQYVLERAWRYGLKKIIITGTSLQESGLAVGLSKTDDRLFATVGCHPTNCNEFEQDEKYYEKLKNVLMANRDQVVALGELGLDYDRLNFCPKDIQKKHFEGQLIQLAEFKLPLFLHCRNASDDLYEILNRNKQFWNKGVVHSFDGSYETAIKFIDMGLFIGINGCSLKTGDNIEVVRKLPVEKLLIETDSPWCQVRPSHASFKYIKTHFLAVKKEKWDAEKMVKGRNEPASIRQILEILTSIKEEEDMQILADTIYDNTLKLFF